MDEKVETFESGVEYEVAYRDIKYPRLEYKTGNLLLVLPVNYENEATLLEKHQQWINKKEETIQQALKDSKEKSLNMERTFEELKDLTNMMVETCQKEFNFEVNNIFFRRMKTKWGSYSSKGNLTVNTLMRHLPKKLINYVIFHELAHSRERRHNERFWSIVERRFKDYHEQERDLLVYWFLIQKIDL